MDWLSRPLADIVCECPQTLRILQETGLDALNEGHLSLAQALTHRGGDRDDLLARLAATTPLDPTGTVDWRTKSAREITTHIVERYHDVHRSQFADLIALSERVISVHPDHPQCPHGLTEYLHAVFEDLFMHMMKEENILFPMLSSGALPMAEGPIRMMQMEHVQHTDALKQLKVIANAFVPPDGACGTWRRLYSELERLYEDLMMHIHIENNILFIGAHA